MGTNKIRDLAKNGAFCLNGGSIINLVNYIPSLRSSPWAEINTEFTWFDSRAVHLFLPKVNYVDLVYSLQSLLRKEHLPPIPSDDPQQQLLESCISVVALCHAGK